MGAPVASWLIALGAALAPVGCVAERPDLIAGDGSVAEACTPFADLVVEYKPGGGDTDPAAAAPALGGPDDAGVPVVLDTVLTVAFVGLGSVIDVDGADIGIALVGAPTGGGLATAYVSEDGAIYEFAAEIGSAGTTIDLATAGLGAASFVRLVGQAGELSVDAIEAIQATCPSPAR